MIKLTPVGSRGCSEGNLAIFYCWQNLLELFGCFNSAPPSKSFPSNESCNTLKHGHCSAGIIRRQINISQNTQIYITKKQIILSANALQ